MANDEEDHALVADEVAPTEFALMANTSAESKKLETLQQEKEGVDGKLAGLLTASKDLDNLIESQRSEKNKEGLGYTAVPPPTAQLYLSPKKDLSWTGLPKCADDTVTDYSRPSPTVESISEDDQNKNPSETVASPITSKPFIKFVKPKNSQSDSKTDKKETLKKPPVKYAEQYRKLNMKPNVRRNQRNWNNLKSHQLGPDFVMKKKACFNSGNFNHLANDCRKRVKKNFTPRHVAHKPYRPLQIPVKTHMNDARPNRTFFNKQARSYTNRSVHRTSAVRSPSRAPWVPTININYSPVNRKFSTGSRNFPTANRKFPTASRKFPTGSTKGITADMGLKGKAVKPSACWFWRPLQNLSNKGYWDSGCSRHMTGNISYLSDFEPYDGGYVSFGQGGCKITGNGTIKMGKLEFENVYFMKDLKYNLFSMSQIYDNKNSVLFTDSECIVLERDFKGLPTKCYENDHTCTAYLKGKQHKASCKSKLVNSVTKPLHTLHMDLFGPTSKGIKREFSNSRTPQQNGVAERRNRTLIEAARTMLADAKLPVTFWAEAVNTTCYVQNRVLVNTSHNKTPYELVNGRSPAIGFLKPFGCHVMILNTLDNLGKFEEKGDEGIKKEFSNVRTPQQNGVAKRRNRTLIEAARTMLADAKLHVTFWAEVVNTACYVQNRVLVNKSHNKTPYELFNGKFEEKGDEGYFIGYSMSSKAFRVFNKRTRRVEENLHVEFLENKAIEIGADPNWLFDIDSLTKSMNYVPVDAGTISTNLSEFSSSEPQDNYSTEVPEGSGNSNPTASASNPPAGQMDTLILETPIPTVSSSVPTAYSTDSQEPSSDTRLILKRVDNQKGTPSLDNILSLSNQFEDILRGTTNSNESNGDEADISNMETVITASPTLTLRIYKDHPKSQIIGPVDTPIQTRNKSKEPPGFQDPEFPAKVYKVEKDMYGLHQAPRAWSSNTPMDKENPWGKDGTGKDVDHHLYRSMIGSLMYLTTSRPDIMFVVCACARHQVKPKERHLHAVKRIFRYLKGHPKLGLWYPKESEKMHQVKPKECHLHAVKRIFRYLKGHPKLGLWYPKESLFDLVSFSDSDYGGATQDRKSTTRGCQFLGRRLISWQCKKQTIVAISTTKAEYVAAASCCGQVLWIQNQLLDYGLSMPCEALSREFSTSILRLYVILSWVRL
nr:hypothetical protein [Tanacetum cinerariifolium]